MCLSVSDGRGVCGMVRWYRDDAFALGASPRGLGALVERGGRLLFIRGKSGRNTYPSALPQRTSEASCAARAAEPPGNAGLTDCNNQPHPVGQRPVLTLQRPRSETAVGDGGTKSKFRDDHPNYYTEPS